MKKRNIALIVSTIVFAAATAFAGCSPKKAEDSSADLNSDTVPAASDSAEKDTQPDPEAPTEKQQEETSSAQEAAATEPAEEPAEEATQEGDASDSQGDTPKSEEELLIDEAQKLFDKACETNWSFHVGSPYNLDYNTYIENNFGWQYYLVTDSGINSIADVEADYFKVFSSSYGSDLAEIYMEKDGRVYALDGARGADIFYVDSAVVGIKSRSDSEIVFTVENYYNGDDFTGAGDITETDEFSVVIESDGSWRAGKFSLPY